MDINNFNCLDVVDRFYSGQGRPYTRQTKSDLTISYENKKYILTLDLPTRLSAGRISLFIEADEYTDRRSQWVDRYYREPRDLISIFRQSHLFDEDALM